MKVVCITRYEPFLPVGALFQRIEQEFLRRGHSYVRVNPADIRVTYGNGQAVLTHPVLEQGGFDLIDHVVDGDDERTWEIVEILRARALPMLRSPRGRVVDKVTQARAFHHEGVPMPQTWIVDDAEGILRIAAEKGFPLIGKARAGARGNRVRLLANEADVHAFVAMAQAVAPVFVVQEAITPLGQDYRLFVVGDKVVAAMKRFALEGDFRSNYSLSRTAEPYHPSVAEEELALRCCRIFGLTYAGVDLMRREDGSVVVLEVNKSPGSTGLEAVTGCNVAGEIVGFWERQLG